MIYLRIIKRSVDISPGTIYEISGEIQANKISDIRHVAIAQNDNDRMIFLDDDD